MIKKALLGLGIVCLALLLNPISASATTDIKTQDLPLESVSEVPLEFTEVTCLFEFKYKTKIQDDELNG